ncbi:MAG TPA: SLC13 family permease, partial [Pirellulales bacterium]
CFLIPSAKRTDSALIPWNAIGKVPWEILLLFGGGLALAEAMQLTKLDAYLGGHLAATIEGLSPLAMMTATALSVTFFSEVASNLACIQMTAPLLKETALQLHLDPRLLLVPATVAASAAFMMPVGTPPNAIAYGTGRIRIGEMMWAGFWLNLIGVALVVIFTALIPV